MTSGNECPLCGKANPLTEWVCEDCGVKLPMHGQRNPIVPSKVSRIQIETCGEIEYLRMGYAGKDWYGAFTKSPSGEYLASWIEGFNVKGGRVLVLRNEKMLLEIEVSHPRQVLVSNTGTCFIHDTGTGEDCSGVVSVVGADGKVMFRHTLTANIGDMGLEGEARFACCQTFASKTLDSDKIHFFDLHSGTRVWAVTPVAGNMRTGTTFEIDANARTICHAISDFGTVVYDFSGRCLNLDEVNQFEYPLTEWQKHWRMAEEAFEELEQVQDVSLRQEKGKSVFAALKMAYSSAESDGARASTCRFMGEVFEVLEMPDHAIKSYEKALGLDAKVGVKRRLAVLKRRQQ